MDFSEAKEVFFMVFVKKGAGQSDDQLIKIFGRKVIDEGIILEVKRRQFHLKPSAARKLKQQEARANRRRPV